MEKSLWNNLLSILWAYRLRFCVALLFVIIANALTVAIPLLFRQAVIHLYPGQASVGFFAQVSTFLLGGHVSSLRAWVLLLLLFACVAAFFKYHMRVAFISVSRDAERDLRSKLFQKIQAQSMAFYDRHGIGELLSIMTNDISAYRDLLGPGIMYPLFFATLVIPGVGALFMIQPRLAILSLIPLVAIPILNLALRRKIYTASRQSQKGLADMSNQAQEHYTGIRIVKGYGVESVLGNLFANLGRRLISVNIKLNCFQGMMYPFFTLITKLVTVFLVMASAMILINSRGTMSSADFVSFMWIQSYIFFPILMLAWVLPIYGRGRAAYDRLFEIYSEPVEVVDRPHVKTHIPPQADIEFRGLTFRYPGSSKPVLKAFSLHIKSGSFVGITGPVAAGKTTLFRILNREYEVPDGTVFIAGRDIHDYMLTAFGKEIVTVEQLPFLFSKTIAENVRFGKEEAPIEELVTVAKHADLHDTVVDFPEKYDTLIGERGVTLSGGQKQRVAIARAFLVDRSILLLDDVFSAVDSKTEGRIFEAMKANFKNKTVLLITQRLSILEAMDRVIYMEDGRVVEDGTPAELRERRGKYAALKELQ